MSALMMALVFLLADELYVEVSGRVALSNGDLILDRIEARDRDQDWVVPHIYLIDFGTSDDNGRRLPWRAP